MVVIVILRSGHGHRHSVLRRYPCLLGAVGRLRPGRNTMRQKKPKLRTLRCAAVTAGAAAVLAGTGLAGTAVPAAATTQPGGGHSRGIQHVLLISVDGMHQSDLNWYVAHYPGSELARLATGGAEYTGAQTTDPSDSDPGGTGIMTGGDPQVTGIYYDTEYSHGVFPPGTTSCSGPVPGGNVIYDSPGDKLASVAELLHNGSGNTFPSFDEGGSIYPGGDDTKPGLIRKSCTPPQAARN